MRVTKQFLSPARSVWTRRYSCSNESGIVLLGSLFVALVVAVLMGAALVSSESQLRMSTARTDIHHAFYAAEAGINRAIFELRQNPNWAPGVNGIPMIVDVPVNRIPGNNTTTIGFYSLRVANGPFFSGFTTRWIESIGLDARRNVPRVNLARVIIVNPARFMILSLGPIRVGSGAVVQDDMLAKDFFFDVNESLPVPDRNIIVNGDVYFLNSVSGETNPAVNFGPDSDLIHSPSITFPGVDLNRYREIASLLADTGAGVYAEGGLTVNLDNLDALNEGGHEVFEPQIIFSEGDVHIRGEYEHSLLVVAGKDIYIDDDIRPVDGTFIVPQLGLFAKQDVIIPNGAISADGDINIEAFIIADGEGDSEGIFKAEGGVGTLGTLNFTGAVSARGDGDTAVNMNAFGTRNYNYNPNLANNRSIPFSPFIVNMIEWRETEPGAPFPP